MNAVNIVCGQPVIDATRPGAKSGSVWGLRSGQWQRVWRRIARAYELHRQRQALLELDSWALKDIGISAADAWQEGHLPFWVDSNWRPGQCRGNDRRLG